MFNTIRSNIEQRVITWKLGQIRLGVRLAIEDYSRASVSVGLLPTKTAHEAWKAYTMRRYHREEAAKRAARRIENRRRGYSSTTI